ncbi:MAG: amidohydrolase family protein [Halioglobus sp.]|nr:amidohydrolase family protein [Halioglobus sp.]
MRSAISADSHICETQECFARIDPAFEKRRPRAVYDEKRGALLEIEDLGVKVPMGIVCTAGRPPEDFARPVDWDELHPAGYQPVDRIAIQDEEGIAAEVLYPSLGMVLCNHPDTDYKKACFDAYNLWLADFCAHDPARLLGVPLLSMRTPEEAVMELRTAAEMGFRGVMLPGNPPVEDYDQRCYDPFWSLCVELGLPVSFHILTTRDGIMERVRGSRLVHQIVTVRGLQNIVMMMILGGVFDRHPDLQVVCVESDAGWVPHFKFRMDHAYERHRFHLRAETLQKKPSSYFDNNIHVTFQDDYSVKQVKSGLNLERVMWASDFPHSDGTYPHSRAVMAHVTAGMSDAERAGVLYGNAAKLYGIEP